MKGYNSIEIYYDESTDFLELSFGVAPQTEYTEDLEDEILVTKDRETNEVKSIAIINFKTKAKEAILKRILSKLGMSIPLNILPN
ncbi:MAG TPA: hypothetical protein VJH20_05500 [Candidatus Nanoarchaeia archaeon]|nr:hypothetical protein [Candidatus Nanoarchaeia archaeon]